MIEKIKIGSKVDIIGGYLIIQKYNGSIFYCEEHIIIDDDNEEVNKRNLTKGELQRLSFENDGIRRKIIFDNDSYDEEEDE